MMKMKYNYIKRFILLAIVFLGTSVYCWSGAYDYILMLFRFYGGNNPYAVLTGWQWSSVGPSDVNPSYALELSKRDTLKIPMHVWELENLYWVTTIGDSALNKCLMRSVHCPLTLESIGRKAFKNCNNLSEIRIPNPENLKSIGDSAFLNCYNLKSFVIPTSVSIINAGTFSGCESLDSIDIPIGVLSIKEYAFKGCGIKSIYIPETVQSLSPLSFCQNPIESITVSSANNAFDSRNNCNAVIETERDNLVFGCKNTLIPNSVRSIGDFAFIYCVGLNQISIPYYVDNIGNSSFQNCTDLKHVSFPKYLRTIGDKAFYNCSGLTQISIPNYVTNIGKSAFRDCSALSQIEISSLITTINDSVFSGCSSLIQITIPDSVTSIGNNAFYNCTGLISITIPNHVSNIGKESFGNCHNLNSIYCQNPEPPECNFDAFSGVNYESCRLFVPKGSVNLYKHKFPWMLFTIVDLSADVNDDGEVNIADINTVIDCILKGNQISTSDVNCDGEVNIADINVIIDCILKG